MKAHPGRAAAYAVFGAAAFAVTGACIKSAAVDADNAQIVFFRSFISLMFLMPWALRAGRAGLATRRIGGHLSRGLIGLTAMICFFYSIPRLPLAEAMLLNYSAPLYLPFVAWLWLGEKPGPAALIAGAVGMIGIGMIAKPTGAGFFQGAAVVGLMSGLLAAGAMVGIRRISDTEPAVRIVFYFSLVCSTLSLIPMLASGLPPSSSWLALLGTGASATLGQLALTRAYGLAPAAYVGPFTYTTVLFSAALAFAIWGETLDSLSIAGGVLVIASCVLVGVKRREPRLEE